MKNKLLHRQKQTRSSTNTVWIVCLLIMIVIALVSFICSERTIDADKIMNYISFASVILSITLSVFAIMYTYTSNVQIQQQFEKINAAAENIQTASKEVTRTEQKLSSMMGDLMSHIESIDESQKEVTKYLNEKPTHQQEPQPNYFPDDADRVL